MDCIADIPDIFCSLQNEGNPSIFTMHITTCLATQFDDQYLKTDTISFEVILSAVVK